MKTFVINLDKNPDRMASMKRQLDAFGIEFERFPAVYGKSLTKDELKRGYNNFRAILVNGKPLQPGEIGCALSHAFIYKRLIKDKVPLALIFEDDVTFLPDFPTVLRYAIEHIDVSKKQVVLFNSRGVKNPRMSGEPKLIAVNGIICSEAYLITLPAIKEIIRVNYPIVCPCDKWRRFKKYFGVEVYRAEPMTEYQDGELFPQSDIIQKRKGYKGLMFLLWKISRCIECAFDRLLILIHGR